MTRQNENDPMADYVYLFHIKGTPLPVIVGTSWVECVAVVKRSLMEAAEIVVMRVFNNASSATSHTQVYAGKVVGLPEEPTNVAV